VWTFPAEGDVSERLEWLTDVMRPPTAVEQRRRLREAPRMVLKFETLADGDRRRQMEHLLTMNAAGEWDVPLIADTAQTTAAAAAGAGTLSIDTTGLRLAIGDRVLVQGDDPRAFEIHELDAVGPSSVGLVGTLEDDWPVGTRVTPLRAGRLASTPYLPQFTGNALATTELQFSLTEPVDVTPDAGEAAYRGEPVLELQPEWSRDPETSPGRDVEAVDNETGVPVVYDLAGVPLPAYRLQMAAQGAAAIAAFRALLYALAGRWAPIWVPSQADDFRAVGAIASGGTTLDVAWVGISEWELPATRRDIRLELVDGTVLYRRITGAVELSADVERIAVDAAWGEDATAAEILQISYLTLCRQDADTNLLRFPQRDLLLTELSLRAFNHAV
jgi:hypothetical protein